MLNKYAEKFLKYIKKLRKEYRTNNLLVPYGGDFTFQNPLNIFNNLDKVIQYMNRNYKNINVFYSTPNEYFQAIHKTNTKFPTKYDDFLPYADKPHLVWSGFFTSRPTLKMQVRHTSSELYSEAFCLALDYLANGKDTYTAFKTLFDEMGVLQHHDAITGTSKQHVADDYRQRLSLASATTKDQFLKSFKRLSGTPLTNLTM